MMGQGGRRKELERVEVGVGGCCCYGFVLFFGDFFLRVFTLAFLRRAGMRGISWSDILPGAGSTCTPWRFSGALC